MSKSALLIAVAVIAALALTSLSTAMKVENFHHFVACQENTGIIKFTFSRNNGYMILIFDSRPEFNGLALSTSSITKALTAKGMSAVIENHKYYASYTLNVPKQLSDFTIQMEDNPISIYVFHPSDGLKTDEVITHLYFSNGQGEPIPVEAIPGNLRIPEGAGFVDEPIVMVTLENLDKAGVVCIETTSATTARLQNYGMVFVTERGSRPVPVVFKLFIPTPIQL